MFITETLKQLLCRHVYDKVAVSNSRKCDLWECKKCEQLYLRPRYGRGMKVEPWEINLSEWDDEE